MCIIYCYYYRLALYFHYVCRLNSFTFIGRSREYMKSILLVFVVLFAVLSQVYASHISGGELFYEDIGAGATPNTRKYKITMRLFRDCQSTGQTLQTESVVIGIYSNSANSLTTSKTLALQTPIPTIRLSSNSIPCLTNAPDVCFSVGIFTGTIDLPITGAGYTLTWIRCCRPENLSNMSQAIGVGATFATKIPGTNLVTNGINSSPQFEVKDTALVCQNKTFQLDFSATDPDKDSISYAFCSAYLGGTSANPNPGNDPGGPPALLNLNPLSYSTPFSGSSPLGAEVDINPITGKITGKAPTAGRYVLNVCAREWRNGIVINEHRKDFILAVGNCDFAAAEPLPVTGAWCKDFKVDFANNNTSSTIQSYYWDFGVANTNDDVSTQPLPTYQYKDTGVYTVKLVVTGLAGCIDSAVTQVGVYPGFKADFDVAGSCFKTPFQFLDKTAISYGNVTTWKWDFGDVTSTTDVAATKNATYTYPGEGTRNVKLVVTSSKGCIDSITKPIVANTQPFLRLPFSDTLICSTDTLLLSALGSGIFSWAPAYNILQANTANPAVYPKISTTYAVTLNESGCTTTDSLRVNVVNSITVDAGNDSAICLSDNIILSPVSQALEYSWQPMEGIVTDPNSKNVTVKPGVSSTYYVTAKLGKCIARDSVFVKVTPYPQAHAGSDVTICYGTSTSLAGTITGASFSWSPNRFLSDNTLLTPIASPRDTTAFVLTVYDTIGCPKPFRDTVMVNVIPIIKAFAGNDTSVIANQPLQLTATGGTSYRWSPTTGMNDGNIPNPVVTLNTSIDSILYKVRVSITQGCFADDEVKVRVYKTAPDIFIPTAFTPNADGRNDVLKPIPVGITTFNFFRVYNRWGQLLFSTNNPSTGWNGTFGGKDQPTGTYVFMAEGVNFLGQKVVKKGTALLIR